MKRDHAEQTLVLYEKKEKKSLKNGCKEIDLLDLELYSNYEESIEFTFFQDKVINGKTIVDWLKYEDFSLWWLIQPTVYSRYQESVMFIKRLESFLNKHNTSVINLKGNYDKISIVKQICQLRNIELTVCPFQNLLYNFKQKIFKIGKKWAYYRITRKKYKKRLDYFKKSKKDFRLPKNDFVLITSVNRLMISYTESGEIKHEELILQPLLEILQKNKIPILGIDFDYTFRGQTEILGERLKSNFNWIPIELLVRNKKNAEIRNKLSNIEKKIKELESNGLEKIFKFEGISIWDFLKSSFTEMFYEPYLPTYLHYKEKFEEFFNASKPISIIQLYETGPYAKVLELAAKKNGIKTVGIQHATIFENNANYLRCNVRNEKNFLGNPIPDKTLVFGIHDKNVLIKNGYPENKISIIGNPKYYEIEKFNQVYNKEKILRKYGFEGKKIVLIGLSDYLSYSKSNASYILLNILYENFLNDNKIFLIRPHPGDDTKKAKSIIEKTYSRSNFIVSSGSLYEDLTICDLVITINSSISVDAIFFKKPIILLNVSNLSRFNEGLSKVLIENQIALSSSITELPKKISIMLSDHSGKIMNGEKWEEFMNLFYNYGKSVNIMKEILE